MAVNLAETISSGGQDFRIALPIPGVLKYPRGDGEHAATNLPQAYGVVEPHTQALKMLGIDEAAQESNGQGDLSLIFVKPEGVRWGFQHLLREQLLPEAGVTVLFESPLATLNATAVNELYSDMTGMEVFDNGHIEKQLTAGPGHLLVVQSPEVYSRIREEVVGDSAKVTGLRGAVLDSSTHPHDFWYDQVARYTGDLEGLKFPFAYNGVHSPRNETEFKSDVVVLTRFIPQQAVIFQRNNLAKM